MSKCTQCRKIDAELDSWWDRLRLKLFNLFHRDIVDLSQDKYTQGFSDGYVMGRKHEKEDVSRHAESMLDVPTIKSVWTEFPLLVDIDKVLTINGNKVLLNGEVVPKEKVENLKMETVMFGNSLLWDIMTNTIKHQAEKIGWEKSQNTDDLMHAKMMVRTIDIQTNIINKIKNAN